MDMLPHHSQPQVRVLVLNEGENKENCLFRFEKGWQLRFTLGPSLHSKLVRIFCNHPQEEKQTFERHVYHELKWVKPSIFKADNFDDYAEVKIIRGGSFNYFFTICDSTAKEDASGLGYFLVDPMLNVGKENDSITLDCIQCQSILSKSLGPFSEWEGRLLVAKESGYNMIHFTPLQELGYSNSAYSLKDQLHLNSNFSPSPEKRYTFEDVAKLVKFMKTNWNVLSMTDLVYNHTASNSQWIHEHPECGYNLINSPHLRPAYIFDRVFYHFNAEIADGKWEKFGISAKLSSEDHLQCIKRILHENVLPRIKIYEFAMAHVANVTAEFRKLAKVKGCPPDDNLYSSPIQLKVIQDPQYKRLGCTIDMELALKMYNRPIPGIINEEQRLDHCCKQLQTQLEILNHHCYEEIMEHLQKAVDNILANARYRFLDSHGLRLGTVTKKTPIMWQYFYHPEEDDVGIEEEEKLMYTEKGASRFAYNGWVMNDDPLRNFAEPGSNIYLRRELIVWGDSVKLRYGRNRDDCPYLWDHMLLYTQETARIFQGVRLDNCHSTPLHVAEFMLDEARKIQPDLYVVAELFTSSEHMDNIFINKLGINSLIREAMSAWDAHEEGRLVYRYGGLPAGAFIQPHVRPLVPSIAHALFMDQTHDNPSPIEKRSVYDLLPSAALVSMACCATGSNRGYDELVPHHVHVVNEKRLYSSWSETNGNGKVGLKSGIIAGKKALNRLHYEMGMAGFSQVYVDQVDPNIVAVTRHNPLNHQTVICVARTAFSHPNNLDTGFVPPLCVPGQVHEIILEAYLKPKNNSHQSHEKDPNYINGLNNYVIQVRENVKLYESEMIELNNSKDDDIEEYEFVNFPPGSVLVIRVSLNQGCKNAILSVRKCLSQFGYRMRSYSGHRIERSNSTTDFRSIVSSLSLADLNRVLFRCEAEEHDDIKGGTYHIPNCGNLPYCGLQGFVSVLTKVHSTNDLGHPLCENLRNGNWMPNYISNRLKKYPGTKELGHWFEAVFEQLSNVPRYLIPCYFDAIVCGSYAICREIVWMKMSKFVQESSSFVQSLSLATLQFCGTVKTAPLPKLSPNLATPLPPTTVHEETGKREQSCITISAGLPHFAEGVMRNWGRDTFIALRGLLLLTGRYQEARYIILAYAATLRHGLIPNLLGAGSCARYNCRDAVWWWLYCIQIYCEMVPDGFNILEDKVSRLYPKDDSLPEPPGFCDQLLKDVIQEAMVKHFQGTKYRERHAGQNIDREMTSEGFNVEFGVNLETGFVCGGSVQNCGTWMDKMGSSHCSNNKGKPATPRDGSAVELVGLSKSTVRWLSEIHDKGLYPYEGVSRISADGQTIKWTYKEWNDKIQQNFEKYFFTAVEPYNSEENPDLINRRGIYKDSYKATQFWSDYQLRPNFHVAMVTAPEMFTPKNAWTALAMSEKYLLGPLGMKTLDPGDWAYNGDYINSVDCPDYHTAKGFNYHQGPEWLWPVGYFLRAKLRFAKEMESIEPGILQKTIRFTQGYLAHHHEYIQTSDWRSLPELTNSNGKICHDSCPAQAWSIGSMLEVMYDIQKY
ncbi:glycogen debranching enzyme-like [Tubulanus polymorphus]|uniref:glycogen debranching enzyme-like n=1 Tax=Tubulanus polymorphus TaxID=672921 RepID=UPI003DA51632